MVLEKTLESPLDSKEIKPVNPKGNQPWIFIGKTEVETEAPILWPPDVKSCLIGKDWRWERLRARGEGGSRGWDGWMASPTQWTWVWASSKRLWRTGKPGMLQSMGLQRVKNDLVTKQSWIFIGRADAEAETLILWPSDAKNWLMWKGPDARKDWRQEEKGTTEDEIVGWHHRLNGHEFE